MTGLFETELLDLVRSILQQHGFDLDRIPGDRSVPELLVAENPYFGLAVGAAASIDELDEVEAHALNLINERVKDRRIGGKRWDLYLVLLTRQEAPDALPASELFEINQNTRGVRRIAHTGIRTIGDVERVLRPFVPVKAPTGDAQARPLLSEFAEALVQRGVDRQLVERSVAVFKEGESLQIV
jgi:hypothetical protein